MIDCPVLSRADGISTQGILASGEDGWIPASEFVKKSRGPRAVLS